jgi:flagellar protein FlaG
MSISTGPIGAGDRLQHSHKTVQPVVDRPQGAAALKATPANVPGKVSEAPAVKTAAESKDSEAAKLSIEQTRQSLEEINKALDTRSISVQFQIDPEYKDVLIKVVDQDSGKVIRQIPTEDVVRIAKAIDNLKGLLFTQRA